MGLGELVGLHSQGKDEQSMPAMHDIMKSTKVQTLGANTICVLDWSCAAEKLGNTTTYGNRSHAVCTYPGNGYNGSETS